MNRPAPRPTITWVRSPAIWSRACRSSPIAPHRTTTRASRSTISPSEMDPARTRDQVGRVGVAPSLGDGRRRHNGARVCPPLSQADPAAGWLPDPGDLRRCRPAARRLLRPEAGFLRTGAARRVRDLGASRNLARLDVQRGARAADRRGGVSLPGLARRSAARCFWAATRTRCPSRRSRSTLEVLAATRRRRPVRRSAWSTASLQGSAGRSSRSRSASAADHPASTCPPQGLACRRKRPSADATMRDTQTLISARASGNFDIGGELTVNRLGFGAMRLTGEGIWGEPSDPAECRRVLRRAVELDVNLIDTADAYGPEVSERLIAEALYPYPEELVIATKGGLTRSGPNQWHPDGRPEHLRGACEGSLARLRLERIELYQLHRVDPAVPLEESLGALIELRDEGKIARIGLSNVSLGQLRRARELTPIVVGPEPLQPHRSGGRGRSRGMRARGHRVHSVVPAGDRQARDQCRPTRRYRRAPPRDARPDRIGVAASPLGGNAPYPGHRLGQAPRGERRRGADRAVCRGGAGARRARPRGG